jgi:hypothetical protein
MALPPERPPLVPPTLVENYRRNFSDLHSPYALHALGMS